MLAMPLTQGRVALVDDADYAYPTQWRWRYDTSGYAVRKVYQAGKLTRIFMHRVILNAQPGQLVDHIDGNRLNNTRANLRIVTPSQNQWNRAKNHSGSSPYKGVSLHTRGWMARVRVYGKRIHLGYFVTPELAARVYDAAALHFFGVYARLNFPDLPIAADTEALLTAILKRQSRFSMD
jgi:hypothetical protein